MLLLSMIKESVCPIIKQRNYELSNKFISICVSRFSSEDKSTQRRKALLDPRKDFKFFIIKAKVL